MCTEYLFRVALSISLLFVQLNTYVDKELHTSSSKCNKKRNP